ncbi:hypothetical protein CAPTEDRAFT_206766 [Capitella teleta]|uniref:Uncharacterized protein n=1 Tax=Capitella teleta TaxID=283909 RepID=R7UCD2_CAPTE|nr:hypothetical protein CAPTEDRAFT_206766 [Capitella teleta]|eukprot:ELU01418.1 hypothetical protein CAPTEDRAFT_206766 [Capitella teleta]
MAHSVSISNSFKKFPVKAIDSKMNETNVQEKRSRIIFKDISQCHNRPSMLLKAQKKPRSHFFTAESFAIMKCALAVLVVVLVIVGATDVDAKKPRPGQTPGGKEDKTGKEEQSEPNHMAAVFTFPMDETFPQ